MSPPPPSRARQRLVLVFAALSVTGGVISRNWVIFVGAMVVAFIAVGQVVRSRRAESHPPRG